MGARIRLRRSDQERMERPAVSEPPPQENPAGSAALSAVVVRRAPVASLSAV